VFADFDSFNLALGDGVAPIRAGVSQSGTSWGRPGRTLQEVLLTLLAAARCRAWSRRKAWRPALRMEWGIAFDSSRMWLRI
jgi:hypothetical protein